MELSLFDGITFVLFLLAVIGISLYASRREKDSGDYFLAGRNLTWWLIGFSLIASNISTEHFVGMAGSGFGSVGLAIASYEWIAAITLVIIGLYLLPLYLRLGIYTMPEFLEHRYGPMARRIMAIFMMVAYVGVAIAAVLYSGALGLKSIFDLDMTVGIWLIGILAGVYTIYGGLKAVVWSDLLQGSALLIGGLIVTVIGLGEVGGLSNFMETNADKMHVILPADDPTLPWTALLFAIWIPNFFYWGFNQFITQRTLGAKSLAHGQNGIILAAALKLVIPFIIVFPGIMAFQLYGDQITNGDEAYPVLITNLLPAGLRGVMFAALFGAVMSSLDSMLNSASTIFTMDIYKELINPEADEHTTLRMGRIATAALVVLGCLLAPLPARFEGVFTYIQMVWGFISPGIVVVFVLGLILRRAPEAAAVTGMCGSVVIYGLLLWLLPNVAFLNHMAITFFILAVLMVIITLVKPLEKPVVFEVKTDIDIQPSPFAKSGGIVVILATIALYIYFW
ncbi:MAG: solute:sodium symporter family transporter [Acidobacteriota bacterium]|nr:solute:sodium symporter family transporter [Acidobacteriota bacterium]